MNSGFCSPTLEQYLVALFVPRMAQGSLHHDLPPPLASVCGVGHDVLQKGMLVPIPKQVWCHDQHAGCNDLAASFANEYGIPRSPDNVRPDGLCTVKGLYRGADF